MSTINGGPNIVTDSLVLYLDAANTRSYPGSGTVWSDLSRGGNNGTLRNGPTFNSGNGGSIVFDGVDDFVEIQNQIQFDQTDPFTLSSWVKSPSVSDNQIINNENILYTGYRLNININANIEIGLRSSISDDIAIETLNSINTNTWYHIVGTYDGTRNASGMKIYINGVEESTNILSNTLTSSTLSNQRTLLGIRRISPPPDPFKGNIANVQIYNRALSATEILQNFNAIRARFEL
jgi:hypothetical protein